MGRVQAKEKRVLGFVIGISMLIVLPVLSGCGSTLSGAPTQTATLATATSTQEHKTPVLDSTPTLTAILPQGTVTIVGSGDVAPPYEEIRATILAIAGNTQPPLTADQQQRIHEYERALKGKRVEGWEGWVFGLTPNEYLLYLDGQSDISTDERPISMSITMDKPDTEKGRFATVTLYGLTEPQAELFHTWSAPLNDQSSPERVRFSGTILGAYSWDAVDILVSQAERLK